MVGRLALTLVFSSLLFGAVALAASGQERRDQRDATEPVRTRPLDRLDADGFTPIPTSGGDLLGSDDPRHTTPLPGVAWEPGQPGGGGGNGGPLLAPAPALDDYVVERLPEGPAPGQASSVRAISDSRDWASGSVGNFHPCGDGEVEAPAIWSRDASGQWQLHLLPGDDGVAEGSAMAVLESGTAVGFDNMYSSDCEPGNGVIGVRPYLWEPLGPGVWTPLDLPTPEERGGTARDARVVHGAGLVIVGGSAWTDVSSALLWRRVAGEWLVEDLGGLGGETAAQSVDASGVIVGYSGSGDPAAPTRESFVLVPEDANGDGSPDTWFRDNDGDGVNDLMRRLSPPGTAGQAEEASGPDRACGVNEGAATHWKRDARGGWSATTLPADGFPEGTDAWGMNGWDQIVGRGFLRRGEPRDRALLWQRDAAGDWTVLHLDDVSGKPQDMTIESAKSINGCGDVVAIAHESDGQGPVVSDVMLRLLSSPCDD